MGATINSNHKEPATSFRFVNTTGVALVANEFTVMRGRALHALEAIASLAEGGFADLAGCEFEANSFRTGQATFAAADLPVYFDMTDKKFSNTATVGYWKIGYTKAAIASGILDVIGSVPVEVVDGVATLAAAVDALEVDAATAQECILVPLTAITNEDGTAMTKQATTVAGFAQIANKEIVINIPINCTAGENLQFTVPVPQDLDNSKDITVHVLAGKAADLDVLTLDCEVYPCAAGDVANADIQDTAAQTIVAAGTELIFTCGADGVLAPPGTLSVVLALGGTNDGDAVYIYGAWIEYTRMIMTA